MTWWLFRIPAITVFWIWKLLHWGEQKVAEAEDILHTQTRLNISQIKDLFNLTEFYQKKILPGKNQKMIKIGITGQPGFIGTHLYNRLSLCKDEFELVRSGMNYFTDPVELEQGSSDPCDTLSSGGHEPARRSPGDLWYQYRTGKEADNCTWTDKEQSACFIFSSTQERERDNPYGRSKKEGRLLFNQVGRGKMEADLQDLVIPMFSAHSATPFTIRS